MMNELKLANRWMERLGKAPVAALRRECLGDGERGFSGAQVYRAVGIRPDGSEEALIFKYAQGNERCAMQLFTENGCGSTPPGVNDGEELSEAGWMVQQDLGPQVFPEESDRLWMRKVAGAVFEYHSIGRREALPNWFPTADAAYWKRVVAGLSLDHFRKKLQEDGRFAEQYGGLLTDLEEAARAFAAHMEALSLDERFMVLTHGDLQTKRGAHVYNCGGNPCVIDFGFCRCAPFTVDLVTYFSEAEAVHYYERMERSGRSISMREFETAFRWTLPYGGFIYMYPALAHWRPGGQNRELDEKIRQILC